MSRPDVRVSRENDHAWHVAINALDVPHSRPGEAKGFDPAKDGKSFMYEAKTLANEVPRLALLFGMERERKLAQQHHQCSHDHEGEAVPDNHLTCCLGVECRACPFLAAIDTVTERTSGYDREAKMWIKEPISDEDRDVMKAWTCAAHIAMRGGDTAREGYILTVDDRMFWNNLYSSLAAGMPQYDDEGDDE